MITFCYLSFFQGRYPALFSYFSRCKNNRFILVFLAEVTPIYSVIFEDSLFEFNSI